MNFFRSDFFDIFLFALDKNVKKYIFSMFF